MPRCAKCHYDYSRGVICPECAHTGPYRKSCRSTIIAIVLLALQTGLFIVLLVLSCRALYEDALISIFILPFLAWTIRCGVMLLWYGFILRRLRRQ